MTLANYSIVYNGLTIGNGTNYPITNIEGLGGTAPLRIQDDNRGYIDGSYTGQDFYDERTVYIDVTVLGSSTTTAQQNYKTLQNAFAPQVIGYYPDPTGYTPTVNELQPFYFRLNGNTGDKRMYGRSRGLQTPIDADFTYGFIKTRIMMSFPDPRYYDNVPVIPPTSTSVTLTNNGWATSCPVIYITSITATSGEITNGTLGSTTDGATHMYFSGLTPGVGDDLKVDLLQRVIYYNDVPTRNIMTGLTTGWLQLEPNSTTTWRSNIGSMLIPYQSAYI